MKVFRILFLILIFGMASPLVSIYVKAEEASVPLTIEPIYPENQNPQTKGYFDLSVNSSEAQTLQVRITNNEDKEVTISIKPANAYTNPNGGMLYEDELDSTDTVLLEDAVRLAEFIKVEETVKVPPSTSVEVPIELTVPELDGQHILGGILFTMQGEETETQQEAEEGTANFILKTETVYAIALQLNIPNEVPDNFQFGEAGFIGETGFVFMEMSNDAKKIQEKIAGTYSVSDKDGNELFKGEYGPFKMAPKTKIRYPIQWNDETLEDGDYTLNIKGKVDGKEVSTAKPFTINNKDVTEYVEKTQATQVKVDNGIPIWVWIIGAVLFGLVMFLIGKRRK
ncbi:TPA: DUF916 domain-containing protein [Yersinia enterocolitica]|nr:DUF916 domain-containing protein [Yersinia enterocolitica]